MITRAFTIVVVLVTAGAARAEPNVPELARRFSDQGRALHDLGDYDEAIVAYKQAYMISPSPGILFNMAQAYRLAGDCANAAMLYRRFLERAEDPSAVRIARRQLAAVEPCASRAESAADRPQALARPATTVEVATSDGGHHHHAAMVLAGAGVLVVAAGAYFAVDARDASDQVAAAYAKGAPWSQIQPLDERGRRSSDIATGCFIAGGVAVAAGAVFYALERRDDARAPVITAAPSSRGASVGVSWRW